MKAFQSEEWWDENRSTDEQSWLLTVCELTKVTEEDKMIRLDRTKKNLVQAVKEVAWEVDKASK